MNLIEVMAMLMVIVSRIEAVMHVIDVMAMVMEVMDLVIGSKLY